jgi:hypothetical protein
MAVFIPWVSLTVCTRVSHQICLERYDLISQVANEGKLTYLLHRVTPAADRPSLLAGDLTGLHVPARLSALRK